ILGLAALVIGNYSAVRTSWLGSIVRFCMGEPMATQWVNNTADEIIQSGWSTDLERIADQLSKDPTAITKPDKYEYSDSTRTKLAPDRLPAIYRKLGDFPYNNQEAGLYLRNSPHRILIEWGNEREAIMIYEKEPSVPPKGFFVRKVNARIYVVAQ